MSAVSLQARPTIIHAESDRRFRETASAMGFNPDDRFIGSYVEWEWGHARHVFDGAFFSVQGKHALEFGCHVGGTACVLAALGARVTGIDPDEKILDLARANAARYGLDGRTSFLHVPDTSQLPFGNETFDLVSCISVLQFVPDHLFGAVQDELDRVLKPGGHVVVFATSNRIWPREPHHKRWFVNYIPKRLDPILYGKPTRRGIWPWRIRGGRFSSYRDASHEDGGRRILEIKAREDVSPSALRLMTAVNHLLVPFGAHYGHVSPQIAMVLQKP